MNIEYVSFQEEGYCFAIEEYYKDHFPITYGTDKFILTFSVTDKDEMASDECLAAIKNLVQTLKPDIARVKVTFVEDRDFEKAVRHTLGRFLNEDYMFLFNSVSQFSIRRKPMRKF
jgi:hypothetical protein